MPPTPAARFSGQIATGLLEVAHDWRALDSGGRWAVVAPYDQPPILARFDRWTPGSASDIAGEWQGPQKWTSSMTEIDYLVAVDRIREHIARGRIYQANLCRVLSADLPDAQRADIGGLHALLEQQHPAPFAGMVRLPDHGVHVATASPELFLRRRGEVIESAPIKGTAPQADLLLEKDRAENVMIVDLVRNDLSRVCQAGSIQVPALLQIEPHPGLVHLVSTVRGLLAPDTDWAAIIDAAFPPGSVTGAPKYTACQVIAENEPIDRGPYCGAVGWIDADHGEAALAVAIRTFWISEGRLHFGTGAGITWGSDPAQEWAETQLKARTLTSVAAGRWSRVDQPDGDQPDGEQPDGEQLDGEKQGGRRTDAGVGRR